MDKIFKFLKKFDILISGPHELCHYLAARALGVRATIQPDWRAVGIGKSARWQKVVIGLAPGLVFGSLNLIWWGWARPLAQSKIELALFVLIAAYCASGLFSCLLDFWDVTQIMIGKKTQPND